MKSTAISKARNLKNKSILTNYEVPNREIVNTSMNTTTRTVKGPSPLGFAKVYDPKKILDELMKNTKLKKSDDGGSSGEKIPKM